MKVKIEIVDSLKEDEVVIRCRELTDEITKIQQSILISKESIRISLFKDEKEYYFSLDNILFFETNMNSVYAHTNVDTYKVKHKLYELEDILPHNFMRVSKSSIINLNLVYSVSYNIASSSLIEFYKSHKKVYASRNYYKSLKGRLDERRRYES